MKIAFILPAIGKKRNERYIGTWKMEPLMMSVLAELTPGEIKTELYDDRLELINYDTDADVIAITVETYTAKRAYYIAGRFREKGKRIIMGGYHVTTVPEEAGEFADAIIIGNAETVWAQLIDDLKNNRLKKQYIGENGYAASRQDKSVYGSKKYLPITLIETGRGCTFNCDFCSIASYYGSTYHLRNIDDIVSDIKQSKHKYMFFVDDNIVANKEYAHKLFDEIEKLHIKWTGQGTITMAYDKKLLEKMKKSGCEVILIGFESLNPTNLKQMNKQWSPNREQLDELVDNIHNAGISIYATFLFGFDEDKPDSFLETMKFVRRHNFFFVAFNHLLPFPGTRLYDRLKEENRLVSDKWWLADDYVYGDISFYPKNMTPAELSAMCESARKEFYKFSSVVTRFFALFKRNKSLYLLLIFFSFNFKLGEEVGQKMRIPIGSGLDELPK